MALNDAARDGSYNANMPKKRTETRTIGPDWFLQEWMASKNMTQAELGRRTGWGKATANDIYHGKTEYYRAIVNEAARALEIETWELLMSPAQANRIKRWRAAFEAEQLLIAAEDRAGFSPAPPEDADGRLRPLPGPRKRKAG